VQIGAAMLGTVHHAVIHRPEEEARGSARGARSIVRTAVKLAGASAVEPASPIGANTTGVRA
jgi:hypothetical protein